MKKYALLILFIILSCSSINTYLTDEYYYSLGQTETIKKEVYQKIRENNADSIPLKDWLYIGESTQYENTGARIFSQIKSSRVEEVYVLTTHETKDSTYYSFRIYLRVKK